MRTVTIVDYGLCNLLSVQRALEQCGADVHFADSPEKVMAADRLLLPGVGAFADGMAGLRERGLVAPIARFAASGKPLLGICLGMQMLLSVSEEFGRHEGLGIIPGNVVPIPSTGANGMPHKVPHIGWSALQLPAGSGSWKRTILEEIKPGASVYLVHSYTAVPSNPKHRLADCLYNGRLLAGAIRLNNVVGCQFHPEKSGPVGLRVLGGFLAS